MQAKPEFEIGQRVKVVVGEGNRTPRVGTVHGVIWHHKDARYNYYLEVRGRKVSKRYLAADLLADEL
ncbi:hypothetical protein [Stenotrophomonas sp. PS02289]|uniref:hypothetical protein n=1 Tax=Stenotrophomonas sp. PS02289 TaxID=2991422 RepID=UPI00249C5ACB|nr:hypothetical protein [Stenotrophomonas sp. PS02289]